MAFQAHLFPMTVTQEQPWMLEGGYVFAGRLSWALTAPSRTELFSG